MNGQKGAGVNLHSLNLPLKEVELSAWIALDLDLTLIKSSSLSLRRMEMEISEKMVVTFYLSKIYFNIIRHLRFCQPSGLLSIYFHTTLYHVFIIFFVTARPRPS
jgi:hypothetical protein